MSTTPALTVVAEGDDGRWSQVWAPRCRSAELGPESVLGAPWLDGRVVAWRDRAGLAHVHSAHCAHLGADRSAA